MRDVIITLLAVIRAMKTEIVKLGAIGAAVNWKDDILSLVNEIVANLPP